MSLRVRAGLARSSVVVAFVACATNEPAPTPSAQAHEHTGVDSQELTQAQLFGTSLRGR
jgi:hypothetical protein